jgi:hypothetical protein
MSEAAEQLSYGRASTWSRRRTVRWAVALAIALVAGWSVARYGRVVVRHVRARQMQVRCLNYVPKPGRAIYDNDPDGDGRASPAVLSHPHSTGRGDLAFYRNPTFDAYQRPDNGRGQMGLLLVPFLGRRTSPAGNQRLVTVTLGDVSNGDGADAMPFVQFIFSPQVETLATLFEPPAPVGPTGAFALNRLELFSTPGDRLRILEGRPDPADASHFTIDYVHNGVPGTIDGWLNDDDTVTFGPRAGEFVEQSSIFLRWSPARGALPPGVIQGNWVVNPVTGRMVMSGPTVIDPTTRPVVPKKDDPRFR